jgi:heptosyltransferase I
MSGATITSPPLPPVRLDRIGIVMMSAVGDAVHVMPLVQRSRRRRRRARSRGCCNQGPATLVRGHPLVDDIITFDRGRGWRAFMDVRRELSTRQFDVVLALQVYFKAGLVTSFTQSPVKLGFDRARARDMNWLFTTHAIAPHIGQHVQDQYFEFLNALGVSHGAPEWTLGPWNDENAAGSGSSWVSSTVPSRRWSWRPARRIGLDARTLGTGLPHFVERLRLQPVLVGGRSERELAAEAVIMRDAPMAHSALGSGLRRLAAILDGAAVALSPDTGPLHLAVALRTPVMG